MWLAGLDPVGPRIKKVREDRGETIEEFIAPFAKDFKLTVEEWESIETGKGNPIPELMWEIVKLTHVPFARLADGLVAQNNYTVETDRSYSKSEETNPQRQFLLNDLLPKLADISSLPYDEMCIEVTDFAPDGPTADEYQIFTQICFSNKDRSPVWYVNFYPSVDITDESAFARIYDYNLALAQSCRNKVSIVLPSANAFAIMCYHHAKAAAILDSGRELPQDFTIAHLDKNSDAVEEYKYTPKK